MWNRGMWNEKDPPPPILLRSDGTPIAFSRIPQSPPSQETPAPSELGAGQKYESLRQWKKAKKLYAAYHDYTATAGYDPIQDVLQAMGRAASENTVDCTKPVVGKPGAG